jgi:protein TonB
VPVDEARLRPSGPGPLERQANPITPENPVPRRVLFTPPVYPPEAAAIDARGTVTLRATIDGFGRVAETRRVGLGPIGSPLPATPGEQAALRAAEDAMLAAALAAVREWQYEPPAMAPVALDVTVRFGPGGEPQVTAHGPASLAGAPTPAELAASQENLLPPPWAEGAVRVGSTWILKPPTKTRHVAPVYQEEARAARVRGVVILEVRVEPDGRVRHVRVLRSVPALDQAAIDAVLQWEFTPTVLDGKPVPIIMTVTVQFSLS